MQLKGAEMCLALAVLTSCCFNFGMMPAQALPEALSHHSDMAMHSRHGSAPEYHTGRSESQPQSEDAGP
jgi:hypothetical protein